MRFQGSTMVFIDQPNIGILAKRLGYRLDYKKLKNYLAAHNNLHRAYLYLGFDRKLPGNRGFVRMLRHAGYKIVQVEHPDGRVKENLDMEIAVDMVDFAARCEKVILMSGDGDFVPAVACIMRRGVHVEVLSFRTHTAKALRNCADEFVDLAKLIDREGLSYQRVRTGNGADYEVWTQVQRILQSIPAQVLPVAQSIVINRAEQLDRAGQVKGTVYQSYARLFNELEVMGVLTITRQNGSAQIETIDRLALEKMVARRHLA